MYCSALSADASSMLLRNLVARERRVGRAAGGERGRRELVAVDHVVLVVDHAVVRRDRVRARSLLYWSTTALRQPAAGRVHQAAEIALAHAVGGQQAVLIQAVAAVVGFEGREPERLVLAVVDFRNVDRPARRQRELVVLRGGPRTVGRRLREGRGRERRIAVVPERRAVRTRCCRSWWWR